MVPSFNYSNNREDMVLGRTHSTGSSQIGPPVVVRDAFTATSNPNQLNPNDQPPFLKNSDVEIDADDTECPSSPAEPVSQPFHTQESQDSQQPTYTVFSQPTIPTLDGLPRDTRRIPIQVCSVLVLCQERQLDPLLSCRVWIVMSLLFVASPMNCWRKLEKEVLEHAV